MPNPLPPPLERALRAARGLSPVQKIALGAAFVALAAGGFFFTRSSSVEQYAPLYAGMETADVAGIIDFLDANRVPYQLADAGSSVLVPVDQVYTTRVALSAEGLPSAGGGWAILDGQGITTSAFKQRVDYQRALEAELSNTITSIEGVVSATVRLALPEESVFVSDPTKPTAAVLVRTRVNAPLDMSQVDGITRLVSSAVRGLDPANVTVTDGAGNVLTSSGGARSGDMNLRARTDFEARLSGELTTLLSRITGSSKVSVQVRATMNFDEVAESSERYQIPDGAPAGQGLVTSERTADESFEGTDAGTNGGVIGPDGAIVDIDTEAGPGSTYISESGERNFVYDRVISETKLAPGQVERLSVAVVVDDQVATPAQAGELERLIGAAAGVDFDRGDEVVVSLLPFDTSTRDLLEAEAQDIAAAQEAQRAAQQRQVIVMAVLLSLVLLSGVASVWRARRVVAVPLESEDFTNLTLDVQPTSTFTSASTSPSTAPEEGNSIDEGNETSEQLAHQQKLLGTLDGYIDNRPAEVAQLLRTWLNGDR